MGRLRSLIDKCVKTVKEEGIKGDIDWKVLGICLKHQLCTLLIELKERIL
jgi:hypothetical protein